MEKNILVLGVDGGATQCRARLCGRSGLTLGEGAAGPANIRFGLEESFLAVIEATNQCLTQAGLSQRDLGRTVACLALAGASEPVELAAAQAHEHPFARALITTDAHAACVGAHGGQDGGVVVIGTGSVAWAMLDGRHHRIGGWGFPISDEGSGAWLGGEAIRRVLWAHDGRIAWSDLLTLLFERFQRDPHRIVRWMATATPRDFGCIAPLVIEQASLNDPIAVELMRLAADHIAALVGRMLSLGAARVSLVGGLASPIAPWLSDDTRRSLVSPAGDALSGAVQLAQAEADLAAAGAPAPTLWSTAND